MTITTKELIEQLAASVNAPVKLLHPPIRTSLMLGVVMVIYALVAQCWLGVRADWAEQMLNPSYVIEIVLLLSLIMSGITSSVLSMYPDAYQKQGWLKLPFWLFGTLMVFIITQIAFVPNMQLAVKLELKETICTICIAAITIIPSFLMFWILKKGAPAQATNAGFYAVLTAASVGCLVIRLEEINNSLIHMVAFHYVPTLIFAMMGALLGKLILKW